MPLLSKTTVLKQKRKRNKDEKAEVSFRLENHLFDEQLKFVCDPSRNKIAVCSRRAGKTTACAADLVYTAITNPDTVGIYITLSRNNAKKIIWREIKQLNRNYKLGGVENITELSMTFPNGSVIYLSGAKDPSEIDNFRGMALKLVYIDEAQAFRSYIREMIDDAIAPALMDYSGSLNLIGTPGAIPAGFFHDSYTQVNGWSKHHWTFWNNPFIDKTNKKSHKEMMDEELKRRGVTIDDPSIQREYFGQFVVDSNSLLVRYNESMCDYEELPKKNWEYIMGIDLGYMDADAIAVLAWSQDSAETYLVEEVVERKQDLSDLANKIKVLQEKYKVSKMIIDEGGLGKKIAEELRRRFGIPVEAADKVRKMENITLLNDAMNTGKFKAKPHSKFAQDSKLVEIDRDKSTPDKIRVSDKYHSDIIDAVLYAFKESPAYSYIVPKRVHQIGSREWAAEQEQLMFEKALENAREQTASTRRVSNMGWDFD